MSLLSTVHSFNKYISRSQWLLVIAWLCGFAFGLFITFRSPYRTLTESPSARDKTIYRNSVITLGGRRYILLASGNAPRYLQTNLTPFPTSDTAVLGLTDQPYSLKDFISDFIAALSEKLSPFFATLQKWLRLPPVPLFAQKNRETSEITLHTARVNPTQGMLTITYSQTTVLPTYITDSNRNMILLGSDGFPGPANDQTAARSLDNLLGTINPNSPIKLCTGDYKICSNTLEVAFVDAGNMELDWRKAGDIALKPYLADKQKSVEVTISYNKNSSPSLVIEQIRLLKGYISKPETTGEYNLQLYNKNGGVLAAYPFSLPTRFNDPPPKPGEEAAASAPTTLGKTKFAIMTEYNKDTYSIGVSDRKQRLISALPITFIKTVDTTSGFQSLVGSEVISKTNVLGAQSDGNDYLDIVFVGDKFKSSEVPAFRNAVSAFTQHLFAFEPFASRSKQILVHAIDKTNDFGCYHDPALDRRIICDQAKVTQAVNTAGAPHDFIVVITNDTNYGGSSNGNTAVAYNGQWGSQVFVHELAHSLADLTNEYYTGFSPRPDRNCYHGTPPNPVWLGIVRTEDYHLECSAKDWYRSSVSSLMRSVTATYFNPISQKYLNDAINSVTGTNVIPATSYNQALNKDIPIQSAINQQTEEQNGQSQTTTVATPKYTNLVGLLNYPGPAVFSFSYTGPNKEHHIDLALTTDMSPNAYGVYRDFGKGTSSTITVENPTKWTDVYKCDTWIYWRVRQGEFNSPTFTTPSYKSMVYCPAGNNPIAQPTATPTPTPNPNNPPTYNNLYATLYGTGPATFMFSYTGPSAMHSIDVSDNSAFNGMWPTFTRGTSSPLIVLDPGKWAYWGCNKTIYWRIRQGSDQEHPAFVTPTQIGVVNCTATPPPTPTPGFTYSNYSASLGYPGPAIFNFTYSGPNVTHRIELGLDSQLHTSVAIPFAQGTNPPLRVETPATNWSSYTCGRTMWWRVRQGDDLYNPTWQGPIQQATVAPCPATPTPTRTPTPTPTPSPTPVPQPTYTNISATMIYPSPATFTFTYAGPANTHYIDVSIYPDMAVGTYISFGQGNGSPVTVNDPTKWDKYECLRPLYWRVRQGDFYNPSFTTQIQTTNVSCPGMPTPTAPPETRAYENIHENLQYPGPATFTFNYYGPPATHYIDVGDAWDWNNDRIGGNIYPGFGQGSGSPIVVSDPTKWSAYHTCGKMVYYRYRQGDYNNPTFTSYEKAAAVCQETYLRSLARVLGLTTQQNGTYTGTTPDPYSIIDFIHDFIAALGQKFGSIFYSSKYDSNDQNVTKSVSQLTENLEQQIKQYETYKHVPFYNLYLKNKAKRLAQLREEQLVGKIYQNPEDVENSMLPKDTSNGLPAEIGSHIEKSKEITGIYRKAHTEVNPATVNEEMVDYIETTDNNFYTIQFTGRKPTIPERSVITLRGIIVKNILLSDGTVQIRSNTLGEQTEKSQGNTDNTPTGEVLGTRNEAPITRKIYALTFAPLINGQKIWQYYGWNNPDTLFTQAINALNESTNGRVRFEIVKQEEVDKFDTYIDGYTHNETTFKQCAASGFSMSVCHQPWSADYPRMLRDYGVCQMVNRGDIDEFWIMGGPGFGFYESTMTGPNAFAYNSPPQSNTEGCSKILPIMGYSFERTWQEMIHNHGHRIEATMEKTYGSWEENRTAHNWDKFGLVKVQSPNFDYSGCGSTHYPPNGRVLDGNGYDYGNTQSVKTTCGDFANYPNLTGATSMINCQAWNCGMGDFHKWWFKQIPSFDGIGPDGKYNNWWRYIADPNVIFTPPVLYNSPTPTPTNTPAPIVSDYSDLESTLNLPGPATFSFSYSGSATHDIDMSLQPDMSWDTYMSFGSGTGTTVTVNNPTIWDKYSCGRTFYWRVRQGDFFNPVKLSPIHTTTVICQSPTPSNTPTPPPTKTPTPTPQSLLYSNFSSSLTATAATFNFNYASSFAEHHIDLSTLADMSWNVWMDFGKGTGTRITVSDPAKWWEYSCGKRFYWRVRQGPFYQPVYTGPIQPATVNCSVTPTKTPTPTPTRTPTPTPTPVSLSYTDLSETLASTAIFSFNYPGTADHHIDLSINPAMEPGTWMDFGTGTTSPIVVADPTKWAEYTCGKTFYWHVRQGNYYSPTRVSEPKKAVVSCVSTPAPTPVQGNTQQINLHSVTVNEKQYLLTITYSQAISDFTYITATQPSDIIIMGAGWLEGPVDHRTASYSLAYFLNPGLLKPGYPVKICTGNYSVCSNTVSIASALGISAEADTAFKASGDENTVDLKDMITNFIAAIRQKFDRVFYSSKYDSDDQNITKSISQLTDELTREIKTYETYKHFPLFNLYLKQKVTKLAADREKLLVTETYRDPDAAVSMTLPEDVRTQAPVDARQHIEENTEITGTWKTAFNELYATPDQLASGDNLEPFVETSDHTIYKVTFNGEPQQIPNETQVKLRGTVMGNTVILSGPVTVENNTLGVQTPASVSPSAGQVLGTRNDGVTITKKVFALIFDPIVNGQKIWQKYGWNNPDVLLPQIQTSIVGHSNGRINYVIARKEEYPIFNQLKDGYTYNATSYETCRTNDSTCRRYPNSSYYMGVDYAKILNDYGVCQKLNTGEIDELWLFGAPYFGYYEAITTGPNAFWTNGPPEPNVAGCNRILHIMGFNYERTYELGVHSYDHRIEGTMSRVYGNWTDNPYTYSGYWNTVTSLKHSWDQFSLNNHVFTNFNYAGCGNTHFPPNGTVANGLGYDYGNSSPVQSTCEDYYNYPGLTGSKTPISCQLWGCTEAGFHEWYLTHIPSFDGIGPDGKYNNWWRYIGDPETVVNPASTLTPTPTQFIPSPTPTQFMPSHTPTPTQFIPSPTTTPATPTPAPSGPGFSDVSSNTTQTRAEFRFDYTAPPTASYFAVDVSTDPTMATANRKVGFAYANTSTSHIAVNTNPTGWSGYRCGSTFYWWVRTYDINNKSPIQKAYVRCGTSPTPTLRPSASPTLRPTATATPWPSGSPTSKPTVSPTPIPTISGSRFTNLSSVTTANRAEFRYDYTNTPTASYFAVDVSTDPSMAAAIRKVGFAYGYGSSARTAIQTNPVSWSGYRCGSTFYWWVRTYDINNRSAIQIAQVQCGASPTPTKPPTPTPTPEPVVQTDTDSPYSNLTATMLAPSPATFSFTYTGSPATHHIDVSNQPDLKWGVYLDFGQGSSPPVVVNDPTKWDQYTCGKTLWWRIRQGDFGSPSAASPIQTTTVTCDVLSKPSAPAVSLGNVSIKTGTGELTVTYSQTMTNPTYVTLASNIIIQGSAGFTSTTPNTTETRPLNTFLGTLSQGQSVKLCTGDYNICSNTVTIGQVQGVSTMSGIRTDTQNMKYMIAKNNILLQLIRLPAVLTKLVTNIHL